MKLILGNVQSQAIIGGVDNLLPVNLDRKLREYLSFKQPGWEHTDQAKEYFRTGKGWNGMVPFMTSDGRFPSGFVQAVLGFVNDLGAKVELEDSRGEIPRMNLENFDRRVGDWELRDMQEAAVKKVNKFFDWNGQSIYWPRGIIDAATNAGKNSIMTGIVNNFPGCNALMIINRGEVYKQAVEFFGKHFPLGKIGPKSYTIGRFTVAMQQTLLNRAMASQNVKNDLTKFQIVFCDEAHYAGAKDYARLLSMIPAPIRLQVSGTPLDTVNEMNHFKIIGLAGTQIAKISNKDLIDAGYSLKPTVHVLLNEGDGEELNYDNQFSTNVIRCQYRVNQLKDKLVKENWHRKQILVAFSEIEHGEFMLESFRNDPRFAGIAMDIAHGKLKDRTDRISRFKLGKTQILFGSTIMQEGLNIPNIQVLVFALAGKAKIPMKQFAGRGLRVDESKPEEKELIIIDFFDNVEWLDAHSRIRIKIWQEEQFEVKLDYLADKLGRPKKIFGKVDTRPKFTISQ